MLNNDNDEQVNIILSSFRLHNFLHISIRRVYFTTCFGRKGQSSGFFYNLLTSTSLCFFFATPTLANVYIHGGTTFMMIKYLTNF
jgi:hypothetical protein